MWAEAGSEHEGDAGVWLLEDRAEPEGHTDVLEPAEWRQETVTRGQGSPGEGWAEGVRVSDGHQDYEGGGILQSSSTSSGPALRPGWGHRGEPVRCPAEEVRVPGHRGQMVWAREEAAGGQGRSGWRKLGTGKRSENLAAVPGGGQRHCHWNSLRVGRHQGRCGLADQSHQKRWHTPRHPALAPWPGWPACFRSPPRVLTQ